MKVHNAIIYHCQCCGRVAHREADEVPPHCCGRQMVKAAEETVEVLSNSNRPRAPRSARRK